MEPTGRREPQGTGGKAQPTAGRVLLVSRGVEVREEDQMAALASQAGWWLVVLGDARRQHGHRSGP